MKALTVKQPYAHMIAHCGKDVENRGWRPPWTLTELAIHAGARSGWDEDGEFSPLVREAWQRYGHLAAHLDRQSEWIDFSAIVAVAEVTGCHSPDPDRGCGSGAHRIGQPFCSPWAVADQYHWQLGIVRTLARPVPCSGHLKLWTVPEDVERAISAQLEAKPDA